MLEALDEKLVQGGVISNCLECDSHLPLDIWSARDQQFCLDHNGLLDLTHYPPHLPLIRSVRLASFIRLPTALSAEQD